MKKKSVIVTGASGFVGSHLTKKLVEEGYDVNLIIRKGSNLELIKEVLSKVTIFEYSGKLEELIKIFKVVQPKIVFHLAALFIAQHCSDDVEKLVQSNILFTAQIAESMVVNNCFNIVNTGTSWQHYENSAYNPVSLYAATKQAAEDILKYYAEVCNLKVINLKLTDTYGPNDNRPKLFALLEKTRKEGIRLEMSPGEQYIDVVYIDDVIKGFQLAGKMLLDNKIINMESFAVVSRNPVKLKDLVKIYESIVNKQLNIVWGGKPYRFREVMMPWKSKALPGWKANVGLEAGIKLIVNSKN
jgi:nucleoside-diphosphate-sugar epimerase